MYFYIKNALIKPYTWYLFYKNNVVRLVLLEYWLRLWLYLDVVVMLLLVQNLFFIEVYG